MNPYQDVRVEIAGKLAAAGIPATLNPRQPLPCVLVDGPDAVDTIGLGGIGGWPTLYEIHILAPPPGDADALVWQLEQLAAVKALYPGAYFRRGLVAHAGDDVPAYTVTVSASVPNPNC